MRPFPVVHLGHVDAMLIDVLSVFDKLALHGFFQIHAFAAALLGQAVNRIDDQIESVDIIEYAHVESCRDGALLFVAPNVHVAIGAPVGQTVD